MRGSLTLVVFFLACGGAGNGRYVVVRAPAGATASGPPPCEGLCQLERERMWCDSVCAGARTASESVKACKLAALDKQLSQRFATPGKVVLCELE